MVQNSLTPVIIWAGGKRQLLQQFRSKYPPFSAMESFTYVEPFFGGGAVFFDMFNHYSDIIDRSVINDINPNLINLYRVVRDSKAKLCEGLQDIQTDYLSLEAEDRKKYFLDAREEFNEVVTSTINNADTKRDQSPGDIRRAALLVFLNKTCFNGLYRVNRKGFFNVSFGSNKSLEIFNKHNIYQVSESLQNTTILCGDYRKTLEFVDDKTFLYLDPPYRPLSKNANFNKYDASIFDDESQRELKSFVDECHAKQALFLLSNSDPKNTDVNDNFFDILYQDYNIDRVSARRTISSKASTRKTIKEIIVKNY